MASSAAGTTPVALNALTDTTVTLIQQLETVLLAINGGKDTPQQTDTSSVDTFPLARDSASLIKAHSTKISVLIINEPFTPSAIIKVLRELVSGPIPGVATAAQACDAERYTSTVRKDLAWKCYTVLKELRGLVEKIPRDGKILSAAQKSGSAGAAGKGSMASTGVIWSACDDLMQFSNGGVGGCFIKKVEEFRATLKDVMEELKEWGEEEPDDDDDDDNDTDGLDHDSALGSMMPSTQEMIDDMMSGQGTIPRDDPDNIRNRLESCLKRLRLTTLLYQAIVKRRLKTLPSLPSENSNVPKRLDEAMRILRKLPHMFDELAGAFYELSPDEIDRVMDLCFNEIVALSELLKSPWAGEKDEFSEWAVKFQAEIKKG
ncbi:Putative cyclin-D1-binding protein [Colletotrichum destructivum]|uniref:Cyclin-D1-binding protein n=1 Tax=Colletotrichum destructivum TaxID=34406 RepID=A0AAX4IUQ4_9PEZI|nr:Putative cyclin-D1-binding protein [Colletotrichum destructivum]